MHSGLTVKHMPRISHANTSANQRPLRYTNATNFTAMPTTLDRDSLAGCWEVKAKELQSSSAGLPAGSPKHEALIAAADSLWACAKSLREAEANGLALPFRTAEVVLNVFLPRNPNKLRGAHPDTVAAAKDFIARFESASLARR